MMRDAEGVVSRLTMGDLCVYAQTCKLTGTGVGRSRRQVGRRIPRNGGGGRGRIPGTLRRPPRPARGAGARAALRLGEDLDLYAATADERFDVELDHDDRHLLDNEYSWVSSVVGDNRDPAVK